MLQEHAVGPGLKKYEKTVYFTNEKTCHYAVNMSLFGQLGLRSKDLM